MTRIRSITGAAVALLLMAGCSQSASDDDSSHGSAGTGGTMTGGTTGGTSGSPSMAGKPGAGAPGTGGSAAGAGGSAMAGTGGTGGSAGTIAMAGGPSAGGAPAAGSGGTAAGMGGSGGIVAVGGMSGAGAAGATSMAGASACPTVSAFDTWPAGKGPKDIGPLAVGDMKKHTGDTYGGAGYSLIFTWYGALRFTQVTGDTANNKTLIDAFQPYITGSTAPPDNSASATVDSRAFGVLPLEIFLENGDTKAKDLGLARADAQWANTTSDGITKDARYWIDDMYMITGLQVAAYRATKDMKYLDRAATTMIAYIAALQQTDGLFWHTKDSHAYWGRANGWVAAGMTELLLDMPASDNRTKIMAAYVKQMDALLTHQISGGGDDGCWRQVIDLDSAPAESSCTAIFTYALATGAKNGWLTDPKYATAAQKGWGGIAAKTDSSGKLDKVCPGTGAAPAGSLSSQQQFYATIGLQKGDLHGQAPLLWSAYTLLRTDCPGVR